MSRPKGNGTHIPSDHSAMAENQQDQFFRVEMINFSRGGMCFESGVEVDSGARIRIKRLPPSTEQTGPEEDRGCLAEVKWCKPLSAKKASAYRIGVEYIEPINPKQCLEWRSGDTVGVTPT